MSKILTREEIQENLSMLNEGLEENERWTLSDNAIEKTFTFKSFIRAFGWMSQIAIWAEKLKHHPEWFNVYNRIEVKLTTHDVGGLSELDFKLATKMESFKP
ncbi:4a-hydroxytetrahydrobiopterin dehydratase [Alteromonas stellipolaris]|uniref:4a-hydroxytetrahydrobiopterin dehydratase n=1 Tax=Alteromonas stellipolaris TaxID=233316 RepID=UPI001DFB1021|nr:4a-hydroxytetrahydrobiopterin dehydratase [Alteromonas stellipolaris]MBZ2164227.1 4a-hydroxytetrahydrobiopterin dehydratase [Alteromonas stellipolaris]